MKIKTSTAKKIITVLSKTKDKEIDCDTCFEQLDKFVEMIQDGQDPSEVMPLVKQHLEICKCCTEETEALIEALKHIDFPKN